MSEDAFAQQMEADMAKLFGDFNSNPQMRREFETMIKELGEAAAVEIEQTTASSSTAGPTDPTGAASSSKSGEAAFQETIRKTMERMQESGQQAGAAAASASEDDILAQMLKEMEKGFGGEGGGEEDFNKMLMGMMEQLTNKEILYEPMKELNDKFPDWLEKNKDTVDKAELERYKEQQKIVKEIVAKFDEKDYSDTNAACREYIVERMQKVCSLFQVIMYMLTCP